MAATNEKEADTQEVMTSRQPMRPNQLHACFSRALVVCASRQPVKHCATIAYHVESNAESNLSVEGLQLRLEVFVYFS